MDPQDKLDFVHGLIQHEQRSAGWFKQREGRLTSSDAATALGINPYQGPMDFIFKKNWAGPPFKGNVACAHGQKYEDEAIDKYCKIMGKTNHDFGLIEMRSIDPIRKHKKLDYFGHNHKSVDLLKKFEKKTGIDTSFLAGSPDGIAIDNNGYEDLILLEVKCPYRRKIINGYCPDYYLPQVQLNMAIFDIEKADFIEYTPANVAPKFLQEDELNIVRVHRDYNWFEKNVPILDKAWKEVLHWRKNGIENHPEYDTYAYKEEPEPKSLFVEDPQDKALASSFTSSMFREDYINQESFSLTDSSAAKNSLGFSKF